MEELKQLKDKLLKNKSASWEEFPDIGLYKDQVVAYISKQLIRFDDNDQITSAMINNYIKDKLLPRSDGKKYSKEHLASLIEICIVKQALTVRDAGFLLQQKIEESNSELFYAKFKAMVDQSTSEVAEQIETTWELREISDVALQMAISSYCYKLVCERLISIMRSEAPVAETKKTEKQTKA